MNRAQPPTRPTADRPIPWRTLAVLALVVGAGLLTRRMPQALPAFVVQHVGDALWAVMILLLLRMAWPDARIRIRLAVALAVCLAVECSQLYQAEWLRDLRRHPVGGLILGHGFQYSDLLAYTAGATLAALVEALLQRRS